MVLLLHKAAVVWGLGPRDLPLSGTKQAMEGKGRVKRGEENCFRVSMILFPSKLWFPPSALVGYATLETRLSRERSLLRVLGVVERQRRE
jgi:hypothetical protein